MTNLTPQQIRAIKQSPKGKLPPFIEKVNKGSAKNYRESLGDDTANWQTSEGSSRNPDTAYRNSNTGKAVGKAMDRYKNFKGPLKVNTKKQPANSGLRSA